MSHVTPINESRHTSQQVISHHSMSHISANVTSRMRHVTSLNESCHADQRVTSHFSTRHITSLNESYLGTRHPHQHQQSRHTSQLVESCLIYTNESRHIRIYRDMPHSFVYMRLSHVHSHVTPLNESCHADQRVTSHFSTSHNTSLHESYHGTSHPHQRHGLCSTHCNTQ